MIRFVVFHTGPDTLRVFRPLMEAGRKALTRTTPFSEYIVLTDKETAPFLENDFQIEVCAPSDTPLMRQFVEAQANYEAKAEPGLTVLAGTDCAAARNLGESCPYDLGITYRVRGRGHINNLAYINDHDMGAWFLRRAIKCMPAEPVWYADQESWYSALGPFSRWELLDPDAEYDSTRSTVVNGRLIHLLPCRTHNYFVKGSGCISGDARDSWVFHYKGVKEKMPSSVDFYILRRGPRLLKKSELRRIKRNETKAAKKKQGKK